MPANGCFTKMDVCAAHSEENVQFLTLIKNGGASAGATLYSRGSRAVTESQQRIGFWSCSFSGNNVYPLSATLLKDTCSDYFSCTRDEDHCHCISRTWMLPQTADMNKENVFRVVHHTQMTHRCMSAVENGTAASVSFTRKPPRRPYRQFV